MVHAQGSVLHVTGFFTKNGAKQFLFRRQGGLAFGRDFAHQGVPGLHFRTHINDTRVVQTVQLRFRQIGNVAGDLFSTEFGVAGHHHQLFNVNRGVAVFGHHTLGDQNRVFEVVSIPRHEGHEHVLTQGEFTQVGRCTVCNHVALGEFVATLDDGALVDVGVLVGTLVLDQVVDVHTDFAGLGFLIVHAHHNASGVNVVHHTTAGGGDDGARVNGGHTLNAGSDEGFFWAQNRHGLTLHVGPHQRAVGVIVLQKGHQGRRH